MKISRVQRDALRAPPFLEICYTSLILIGTLKACGKWMVTLQYHVTKTNEYTSLDYFEMGKKSMKRDVSKYR